jgi:nitroreductase
VCHYAPREHALEERCAFTTPIDAAGERSFEADAAGSPDFPASSGVPERWAEVSAPPEPRAAASPAASERREWLFVGLSSIFWREAWKYGERAFRYCQHDLGHAVAAVQLSAARLGWQVQVLTDWADHEIATLLGLDRAADFADAEREAPECLLLVSAGAAARDRAGSNGAALRTARTKESRKGLLGQVGHGAWSGQANRLSAARAEWPAIDEVARATECDGWPDVETPVSAPSPSTHDGLDARRILLQRRSAVAFDGRSTLPAAAFAAMLARLRTTVFPWRPEVHLALFVHRVDGFAPGVYAFLRERSVAREWRAALRPQFLWEPRRDEAGVLREGELYFLLPFDMTWPATRVSCDQDIAGDGFFSLAMLGRVGAVRTRGDWFYRRLFWEAGAIGQLLYLEAEAVGGRGTGIGCFYDDAVHELLGLRGMGQTGDRGELDATAAEWQSLYHFAMGRPVEDARLTTEPGYQWER